MLFDDIRKFGYIKILNNEKVSNHFANLGPDSLDLTKANRNIIINRANKSIVEIKKFLLNQKNISGLVNCYTMAIPFFHNTLISTLFFSYIAMFANSSLRKISI